MGLAVRNCRKSMTYHIMRVIWYGSQKRKGSISNELASSASSSLSVVSGKTYAISLVIGYVVSFRRFYTDRPTLQRYCWSVLCEKDRRAMQEGK